MSHRVETVAMVKQCFLRCDTHHASLSCIQLQQRGEIHADVALEISMI